MPRSGNSIAIRAVDALFSRDVRPRTFGVDFLLVLLVALAANLVAFDPDINLYDEGIILVGSESVLVGRLPYKDFWTMYAPSQFYLSSWLFSIFGPTDLVVRAIGILSKSLIVAIGYMATKSISNRSLALAGAAITGGVLIGLRQDAFPIFPAVAFAIAAMQLINRGLCRDPIYLVTAGLCTGLVACFRHDLGAYSAVASGIAILVAYSIGAPRGSAFRALFPAARDIGYYIAGILLVAVPVAGFLAYNIPLSDLYENLIYIPSAIYPEVRALPWPGVGVLKSVLKYPFGITSLAVYVPFIVSFTVLFGEARKVNSLRESGHFLAASVKDGSFLILITALTCLLFTLKGFVRVSTLHMTQSIVLAIVLMMPALIRFNWRKLVDKLLIILVFIPSIGLVVVLSSSGFIAVKDGIMDLAISDQNLFTRCTDPILPRMRCVGADPDYIRAAQFVRENSSKDDTIYVGVWRHEKIFINAVAFYFFAERQPATKWYELHPGIQTQAHIQREIIAEMEASPPRVILLDGRWDGVEEPNSSRIPSGVMLLDDYIEGKYAEKARFGTIRVLMQK